ncbi:unnamed protein product [Protopolystoma xenopodis]|uniref:Uncharacterized protein n=1 Tax=Protopolystoma xenopodis TaxID=117903 RepID=A0A3S5AHR2_9PLAT|nr:unnamed protein product [Protopolystoma xenopodis]
MAVEMSLRQEREKASEKRSCYNSRQLRASNGRQTDRQKQTVRLKLDVSGSHANLDGLKRQRHRLWRVRKTKRGNKTEQSRKAGTRIEMATSSTARSRARTKVRLEIAGVHAQTDTQRQAKSTQRFGRCAMSDEREARGEESFRRDFTDQQSNKNGGVRSGHSGHSRPHGPAGEKASTQTVGRTQQRTRRPSTRCWLRAWLGRSIVGP